LVETTNSSSTSPITALSSSHRDNLGRALEDSTKHVVYKNFHAVRPTFAQSHLSIYIFILNFDYLLTITITSEEAFVRTNKQHSSAANDDVVQMRVRINGAYGIEPKSHVF
jgi:hypothetical protein